MIVTGASSGIGRATARLLASKGAHVFAAARSKGALEELAEAQPGITPVVADVADDEERAALVGAVGDVDVLVNNAGIGWSGLVEEMPAEQVRMLFEVNVLGLIDLTQRVLPGMLARKRGHIVNVASVAGYVSAPPISVYSASKFAVLGFSDGLRREVSGRGVAVTCVNPGPVSTKFSARAGLVDASVLSTEVPATRMGGVPAWTVARAVARAVRMGGLPGYGTITVPRALGLARLGAVPVLQLTVDGVTLVSRRSARRH
ncbi:MAG TPA: SDR family NAD(P)-dependent oxidoreductase [Acidimicrobiales bacterium]|nr:SDR family NAD(P)-dependent oxidoreductase [Acidimicrobiales bacterium]